MELTLEQIIQWLIPALFVIGGFLAGLIFEWVIIKTIKRLAKGTAWKWDDVLVKAFSHAFIYWFILIGCFFAILYTPTDPEIEIFIFKVLTALATLVGIIVAARIAHGLVQIATTEYGGPLPGGSLLPNTARILIIVIGVIFILPDLGIEITPAIGALGIGGLAAALAFRDTLENLFAGFQMLATSKVRPGNFIQLSSGEIGYVTDINWRETTIRDFSNNLVIIPNAKVSQSIVTNYNLPMEDIYVELTCGVGYDSDLERVEEVVKEEGRRVYREVYDEELETDPSFFYLGFGDSAIEFKTKILVKQFGDRMKVQHPLIKALHKRFKEEGIVIPFPMRTVQIENSSGGSGSK